MALYGFHNVGVGRTPDWVGRLHYLYFIIRVERPRGAKQRRIYRLIEKEKLRLAEKNIDQELIRLTCLYLCSYSVIRGERMIERMDNPCPQLILDFTVNNDKNFAILFNIIYIMRNFTWI